MMIVVNNAITKCKVAISTAIIMIVERSESNPLETKLITTLGTTKGLQAYAILESPEEVAALVRASQFPDPTNPA